MPGGGLRNIKKEKMGKVKIQVVGISSSQEWATDPDMVEIEFDLDFLKQAQTCVDFMQAIHADQINIWWRFGYTLYELVENIENTEIKNRAIVDGPNGKKFVEFSPKYSLDGCNAKIDKYGDIQASFPFKHTSDSMWCVVGKLADLRTRFTHQAQQ